MESKKLEVSAANKAQNIFKIVLALLSMTFTIYIGNTLFKRVKLDATSEKLYTLSEGSKNILNKIDSPINLKLYYSRTAANKGTEGLRAFNNYYQYIKDFLKEYVANSRNNLTLEVIDPRPDTAEEEDAEAYGLRKFQLSESEQYFFGLVAESETGSEKVIDFFDPNAKDKVEYEITKLIYSVQRPEKTVIGVLSPLDLVSEGMNPFMMQLQQMQGQSVPQSWHVIKMLEEFYQVKKIDAETSEINGVNTLAIIHPHGLSEKVLFAVDQFLLKGGKLFVLVDPNMVTDRPNRANPMAMMNQGPSSSPDTNFAKMLKTWGVSIPENTFAGDRYLSAMGQLSENQPPSRLIGVVNCEVGKCSNPYKDIATAGIDQITLLFPGVINLTSVPGIKASTILSTTNTGNTYTAQTEELRDSEKLMKNFVDGTKPIPLGVRLVGKFSTSFPNGIDVKDGKDNNKEKNNHLNGLQESSKESAILILSDVDFINNQIAFRDSFLGPTVANGNANLFMNALESLEGNLDLLSVRTKGKVSRSFKVIDSIEIEAENATASKVEEINARIASFQNELSGLESKASNENIAIIQSEGVIKKKELIKSIALLKKQLREVKRRGREKIEMLGNFFQYFNTLLIPLLIIIFSFIYSRKRTHLMRLGNRARKFKLNDNANNNASGKDKKDLVLNSKLGGK